MTPLPYTAVYTELTEALPYDGDITDQSYNVSAAGEFRQVSLSELRYLMERWQRMRRTETN